MSIVYRFNYRFFNYCFVFIINIVKTIYQHIINDFESFNVFVKNIQRFKIDFKFKNRYKKILLNFEKTIAIIAFKKQLI